jgi:hypothetical protein
MPEAAGNVNIVLSVNKSNFSEAMADAQKQLDQFAGKSKAAGHATVSGMQAASASIRLLENPLGNNTRAIERLLSQSKLLSSVMKAAFPVVGAVAMGMVIAKLGADVVKFIDQVRAVPRALQQGFDSLNLSMRSTNDALDLTNARLANEIAKLEGKPQNNLRTALAESRVEADKLATSLGNDAKAVNDLLTANKIGLLGQFMGKANTLSVSSSVQSYMNDLQALGNALSVATSKGDTAAANSLKQQIAAKQDSGLQYAKSKLFVTDNPSLAGPDDGIMGGDQSGNRAILLGFQGVLLNRQHNEQSEDTNGQLTHQKEVDEAAKAQAEARKQAARAALEAQKKAAAEQLQQWEADNSDWKAAQDRSLIDDARWWNARLAILTTNSTNYKAVSKKVNADIIANNRELAEAREVWAKDFISDTNAHGGAAKEDVEGVNVDGQTNAAWIASLRAGIDLQKQQANAVAEASLQMAVATGQMSKLDAAQVQANMHTQQYVEAMQDLRDARAAVDANGSLTDAQRRAQLAGVDNQMAALNGSRQLQVQQDQQAMNPKGSLASTGFVDALDDFVISTRDAAGQMREITTSTLNSVNGEIVKAISGQRTNFSNMGAGIFRNVAGVGLQKAEGSVLGALGFGGKADGSKSNPLYVRIADSLGGAASSVGSIASSVGGKVGGWFSSFAGMLPGFAGGGAISPGTMALVGEHGPEVAYFGSGASITPNHQLSRIGGGSGDTHIHVDATGSTDPAQTEAAVMRGISTAAPHIVAASSRSQAEDARRTPASRRK